MHHHISSHPHSPIPVRLLYTTLLTSNPLSGHFLLVGLLLPKLKASAIQSGSVSRIVILSSLLHSQPYAEGIRFDSLDSEEGYDSWKAYGQSKLANVLHAKELAKQLKVSAMNPKTSVPHVLKGCPNACPNECPNACPTTGYVLDGSGK